MRTMEDLFQALRAFQESRALLTAVELDLFTAVAKSGDLHAVAGHIGADARAAGLLLDALSAMGLVEKAAGRYRNGELAARCLVDGSPEDARGAIGHFLALWERWSSLTDAVRTGTSVVSSPTSREQDTKRTGAFIAAMHRFAGERATAIVQAIGPTPVRRVLDLGGGSGANSIAIAKAHPESEAVILDLEDVVPLAEQYVGAEGLAGRIRAVPGNMLTADLGSGYDLAVISQICHMFSPEENRLLLQRTAKALVPGGRLALVDFVLNEDRTGPRPGVVFALNMLVATRAGSTYTAGEYEAWLAEAGFAKPVHFALQGSANLIVAMRP